MSGSATPKSRFLRTLHSKLPLYFVQLDIGQITSPALPTGYSKPFQSAPYIFPSAVAWAVRDPFPPPPPTAPRSVIPPLPTALCPLSVQSNTLLASSHAKRKIMQSIKGDKVASPPKSARVEDGKIRKPKLSSRDSKDSTAIQYFNGKTYACESCKRGHRVQKCDHGKTRPISETNQPGRPSGGQKRGCQCPRNCACTTKTCKCDRDCTCTQEMFLIVRVDNPQAVSREATSTPKPVWEDANGNKMTLKKVWADANGREIDEDEAYARKRRMKEREEGPPASPSPDALSGAEPYKQTKTSGGCCGSKVPKQEQLSPKLEGSGGCRHRQHMVDSQLMPDALAPSPAHQAPRPALEPTIVACSCGTACSCLYCPDHPNNATSINHTQQQVKNFAEHAFQGDGLQTNISFLPETDSRSCMGGRPAFFLSRTRGVSQQQLQQFFPESQDPNAIYLTYPIQQHSWTNRPASRHCAHNSPENVVVDPDIFTDPSVDMQLDHSIPWDLLPDDSNGTWNFSDGFLGNNSFSWTDFNASRGTDYSIGQATVAAVPPAMNFELPQLMQHPRAFNHLVDCSNTSPLVPSFPASDADHPPASTPFDPTTGLGFHPASIPSPRNLVQNPSKIISIPQSSLFTHHVLADLPPISTPPARTSQARSPARSTCCQHHPSPYPTDVNGEGVQWDAFDNFLNNDGSIDHCSAATMPSSPPIANGAS